MATITNYSTNPSFETGSGTIEVRKNYVANPSFEVDLTGWSWGSTSTTRTRVAGGRFGDWALKVVPTAATNAQAGVVLVGANRPMSGNFSIYAKLPDDSSVNVSTGALLMELNAAPWTVYANKPITITKTWQRFDVNYVIPAADAAASTFFVVRAPDALINAPQGVLFDGAMIEAAGVVLPYFDGSTNDGFDTASLTPSWTGTANNSPSILTGVRVPNTYAWQAGGGVKIWLSQDNPSQGNSFARYMTTAPTSDLWANIIDTSGVSIGDEITSGLNCRISVGLSYACGSNSSTGSAFIVRTAPQTSTGDWEQTRFAYSSVRENDGMGVRVDSAPPGTIVDIDDHFVVKGTYNSAYFDGSTPGASWTGTANASTSTIDTPFLTLWDGTEEKFVSGVEVI